MMFWLKLYLILVVSSVHSMDIIPIVAENEPNINSQHVGCLFGGVHYDIDSQWHPVLEPYGVMYCLQCTCNAVIRKSFLQQRGQVTCKGIMSDCPDVSRCPQTAILPPNSCCKICPDSKEFSVLLVQNKISPNIVGRAIMNLDISILKITMEFSRSIALDKVKLIGADGKILYQESVTIMEEQEGTTKACITWREAFKSSAELKSEAVKMVVNIKDKPDFVLEGPVKVINPAFLETFSCLLSDDNGQTGHLALGIDTASSDLHIRASLALSPGQIGKGQITLEMLRDWRILFTTSTVVSTASDRVEFTAVWPQLSNASLKQLARGRLSARIALGNGASLTCPIQTFHQCGALKALVTGLDAIPQYEETTSVAIANFSLKPSGQLHYQVEIKDTESRVTEVMMETERNPNTGSSTKITRLAKDLNDKSVILIDGIYDKTDAKEIQLLLEGKLFVNIATRTRMDSTLRGQIQLVPSLSQNSLLLRDSKSAMAAQIWCTTEKCSLTCSMLVPNSSVNSDESTQAYLDFWDQKHLLATFSENNMMEFRVTQNDVQQIASVLPTVRVITRETKVYGQVPVPKQCFDDSNNELLPAGDAASVSKSTWIDPNLEIAHKCSYDGVIYSDGDSWKPKESNLECVTCSCKRNKVQCHPVVCPKVDCAKPVTLPGECCPACPKATDDTSKTCYFPGDHRHHAVGSVWHPFMHPGGYFQCAICFCKDSGSGYDCKALECPKLTCPDHLKERKQGQCCATCKEPEPLRVNTKEDLVRMQSDNDQFSKCQVGDKSYVNGETFNPDIVPFGKYESITCICQNGKIDCKKSACDCSSRKSKRSKCCLKQCGFTSQDLNEPKRRKHRKNDVFC